MNMASGTQCDNGRFSWMFQEWVFQLVLVILVVSALVERGLAIGAITA
jgi:hypothetical protein